MLLGMLQLHPEYNFEGIATSNESWFRHTIYATVNACSFSERGGTEVKAHDFCPTNDDDVFLHTYSTAGAEFPTSWINFNQDYFIMTVLPGLESEKTRIAECKGMPKLSVHMDKSICSCSAKITEKLRQRYISQAPHAVYSFYFTACDFWLFGLLNEKMKDRMF
jgi:hypothetical protein